MFFMATVASLNSLYIAVARTVVTLFARVGYPVAAVQARHRGRRDRRRARRHRGRHDGDESRGRRRRVGAVASADHGPRRLADGESSGFRQERAQGQLEDVRRLHPGGWPRDQGFHTWHTFVTTRAVENTIYIMSTNWAGLNNGGTAFCPPFVDGDEACLNKLKTKPDVLIGTVDMAHLENVKKKYPYLKDRNQDMYAELEERS